MATLNKPMVLTVLLLSAGLLAACTLGGEPSTAQPVAGSTSTSMGTSTTSDEASEAPIPLDGNPDVLGVVSIDFVTAMFPTSPEEHRVTAAWTAIYSNVVQSWVEDCMADRGFEYEAQRISAMDWRRYADLPDFELDAEMGIIEFAPEESVPGPRPSASDAEVQAWQASYEHCSLEAETRRSEGFDQLLGRIPPWQQMIEEVNASPEMSASTEKMLRCISDGGGPEVESIPDLYREMGRILREANEGRDEFGSAIADIPPLIASCAGDLDAVRQQILMSERDRIVSQYADALAEAESFFNDVVAQSGWDE